MTIILRSDQVELKRGVYQGWNDGKRNMLIVQPTGGGKSVVVGDIAKDLDQMQAIQAVIAHRQELVGQMSLHIARAGVRHRIIAPKDVIAEITATHREEFGRSLIDPTARAAVAGIDTLISRKAVLAQWAQQVGYWTIDEAHHIQVANKWGDGVSMFPNGRGLGVTATPERADGRGLGRGVDGVFDDMVIGPTMRELIDAGSLSDYEIVVPASDYNLSELRIGSNGDFTEASRREAAHKSHIVGNVVRNYLQYANGKIGVTFADDVATANEMAAAFNAAGVSAVSISAKTDSGLRKEYIRRFRRGEIRMLVNVDLFGEGFDLPAIEVVIMARPTMSLAVFLQQFGRALRTMFGKKYGLVIDCVSNVKLHGLPDKLRYWTLDRKERRSKGPNPDDVPVKTCSAVNGCGRAYSGLLRACPYCGFMPVPMGGGSSIEQVDGDLMLLDAATLAKLRASITLETPSSVMSRAGHVAGGLAGAGAQARQVERIEAQRRLWETMAAWAGYGAARGLSDDVMHRQFYHGTGKIDVLTALTLPRADMDKLTETINGWIAKHAAS